MMLEKLLLVEDEPVAAQELLGNLRDRYEVACVETLAAADARLNAERFDLIIAGIKLPDGPGTDLLVRLRMQPHAPLVVITSAFGSPDSAIETLGQGAFACLFKPFTRAQLEAVLLKAESHVRLVKASQYLCRQAGADPAAALIGSSLPAERLRQEIRQLARTDAAVLLTGEPGTGKTLLARALHQQSSRAGAPCLVFDCAAIGESILEAELFGADTRVYPGMTHRQPGCCELANGGTLVIREVALLPLSAQARLLNWLMSRTISRLGGAEAFPVDFRLVATTSRDLSRLVAQKAFNEELLFALSAVPLNVPPVRQRAEDVPQIAEHFRQFHARSLGVASSPFSPEAMRALQQHPWPGNLRELSGTIERALQAAPPNAALDPEHLALGVLPNAAGAPSSPEEMLASAEKKHILTVLSRCRGNRTHAALRLGISLRTLRNKLREYREGSPEDAEETEHAV